MRREIVKDPHINIKRYSGKLSILWLLETKSRCVVEYLWRDRPNVNQINHGRNVDRGGWIVLGLNG